MVQKIAGLTQQEAKTRFVQWGSNEIKDPDPINPLKLIIRQLKRNFIIYLLILAAAISFIVGETVTGYTVILVTFIVVSVTFFQEYRAEKSIKALKEMINPVSVVIRDNQEQTIPSRELVPDDIVVLRTGERIPADCLLLEENNARVDEAILTGEAKEIKKKINDSLFMGSFLINGRCLAKVVHTGMNTRFGQIVNMISEAEKELPLQVKVNHVAKTMVIIALLISIATGLFMLLTASSISLEVITGVLILVIALSVSAFPEGLPVVLMTTLAVGANRMAAKNAIVNRMSIIETLGETTIICADKTGTITKGEMTVKKIFVDDKLLDVEGAGFRAEGSFFHRNQKVNPLKNAALSLVLKAAVFCNDSRIERTGEDEEYRVIGSSTEGALLVMAAKAGIFRDDFPYQREEEISFNSERKMMSVLINTGSEKIVFVKGAPEILLQKCRFIQRGDQKLSLTGKNKEEILKINTQLAQNCFRTLAFAYKNPGSQKIDNLEKDLIFLGLVGMEDPPREEIKEAIQACRNASIGIKMITGDNQETARSIAKEIGLSGQVIQGEDLDRITDDELAKIVDDITIFARVRPEHKLRIVRVLKQNGEVVTMTGDGVNDAPALKEAQIGVAMGKNGTDVSRSVADLTLKDDNFATIVEAIKEGRMVFNNIRKFVSYQLSCSYAELIIIFFGALLSPLLGWQTPLLLALQILFMNLVTDDLPAITLALNKSSRDVMWESPRKKPEILNRNLLIVTIFTGAVMAIFTLGVYFIVFNLSGQSAQIARTGALLTLILLEIANAFNFRSLRQKTLTRSPFVNIYLFYASVISIAATVSIIYSPLNRIFGTMSLSVNVWIVSIVASFLFLTIFDILKSLKSRFKSV